MLGMLDVGAAGDAVYWGCCILEMLGLLDAEDAGYWGCWRR